MRRTTPSRAVPAREPLYRRRWDAFDLSERHPPLFTHGHKRAILDRCCPDGVQTSGCIEVSRWPTMEPAPLAGGESTRTLVDPRPGGFTHDPAPAGEIHWWVNFAAGELFQWYAGRFFAQDEIQVFEHPVLGSVREALRDQDLSVLVTDADRPTPFLVSGAHRRIDMDTQPRPEVGRHGSLYGRGFSLAPIEIVLAAARAIEPPTVSDILVMEAPSYGWGKYTGEQIEFCLTAAYTGFRAAVLEADRRSAGDPCVIHTGFWGCGAYGGNRVLMTAVQLIAARLAGVDRLAFYLRDEKGREPFAAAHEVVEELEREMPDPSPADVVQGLKQRGFTWGRSDGN